MIPGRPDGGRVRLYQRAGDVVLRAVAERLHGPATALEDASRAWRRAEVERRPVVLMLPLDVQAALSPSDGRAQATQALPLRPVRPSQAAIVDASAGTGQSWQAAMPFLTALGDSLRVEAEAAHAPAPLTTAAGRAVAGLYMGMRQKYTVNTIGSVVAGFICSSAAGMVFRLTVTSGAALSTV